MDTITIPQDTENILLYLLVSNLRNARTRDSLHRLYTNGHHVDDLLEELIDAGYVYADDDSFELTFAGLHRAKQIRARAESEREGLMSEISDLHSRDAESYVPALDTHPLRARAEHQHPLSPTGDSQEALQFLLAFETPRNVLPIPVLNGDILGRVPDSDICLQHDEYISGEHCRFSIENERNQPTLYVEDLGSRNGTSVNGFQLEQGQLFGLEHGDRVYVGSTVLIVVRIPTNS